MVITAQQARQNADKFDAQDKAHFDLIMREITRESFAGGSQWLCTPLSQRNRIKLLNLGVSISTNYETTTIEW